MLVYNSFQKTAFKKVLKEVVTWLKPKKSTTTFLPFLVILNDCPLVWTFTTHLRRFQTFKLQRKAKEKYEKVPFPHSSSFCDILWNHCSLFFTTLPNWVSKCLCRNKILKLADAEPVLNSKNSKNSKQHYCFPLFAQFHQNSIQPFIPVAEIKSRVNLNIQGNVFPTKLPERKYFLNFGMRSSKMVSGE